LGILDTAVIVVYLCVLVTMGIYFSRRQKTTEDYFLAGRNLPGWVVGFSIMGTIVGSVTFIGHPGEVFKTNMWSLPAHLAYPFVMVFVSVYIVSFYRRTIRMTAYKYLEMRFGYPVRAYGATVFLFGHVLHLSVTFYFLAVAVGYMSGWDVWWVILFVGLATVIYTLVGGIEAVAWSDVIQGNLLVIGGLICLGVVLFSSDAGPTAIVAKAWEGGKFSLGNWDFSWYEKNQWFFVVGGILGALGGLACDQSNVQRYLLARTDKEAARAAYMGAVVCVPIWILFMVIGALTWAFYELSTDPLPAEVLQQKDFIMPYFIKSQLPAGLVGLILAALLAAAMSSIDSNLNAIALVVVNDFYVPLCPKSKDKQRLLLGKTVVVFFGVSSIIMAQQWIGIKSVIELSIVVGAMIPGGILGVFALGFLFRWTTARGTYIGVAVSIIFNSWAAFTRIILPGMETTLLDFGRFNYTLSPFVIGIFSLFVLMGVGMIASLLAGGPRPDTKDLTFWDVLERRREEALERVKKSKVKK
jgi:SSS family solute:Na+ symporter